MLDDLDKALADIESVSEEIREKAILALAATNDVQAIFALKKAAKEDSDLRLRNLARKCLIDLKKEITAVAPDLFDEEDAKHLNLKKLKANLTHADPKMRLNAVRSTVSMRDKKAIPLLNQLHAHELDPVVKGSMLIAVGILGRSDEIPTLAAVLKKEKDPLIRKAAIEGLSYCKDVGAYAVILRVFVSDKDKLVERACMKALNKLGKTNLLKLLERLCGSSTAWKRQVAVRAMGRFNSETVVVSLEKALADSDETVRQLAARSLARLANHGNPKAKEVVERLKVADTPPAPGELDGSVVLETSTQVNLDDPDPNVRLQIISSIANSQDMLKFPALRERLKVETHDYVKAAVVTALYRLGGRAAIPILKECIKEPEDRVRANAVECLSKVGDEANSPLFIQMLKDKDGRTRANAIVALKKCTYIDPVRYIEEMVQSGDDRLVRSAMYAIVEIGSDKAVALLADLAQSDNESLREKAMENLEILKDRNNAAAKKLLVRIKGEQKGAERRATRKAEAPPEPPRAATKRFDPAEEEPAAEEEAPPPPPPAPPPSRVRPETMKSPPPPEEPAPEPEKPAVEVAAPKTKPPPATRADPRAQGGFKLPFDTSQGVSMATLESIKAWLDRLPAAWRIALVALCMVWGMVFLMLIIQFIRGDEYS
jgi:HEAT repeat protein